MDLKGKKKSIVKIILCLLFLIIIFVLFAIFTNKAEEEEKVVNYSTVEKIYVDNYESEECTEVVKITSDTDSGDVDDKVLLYLIFGTLEKDELLTDSISTDDFKNSALKVLREDDIPLEFTYIYKGYKYTSDGKDITRSRTTCDSNYVTKIYGYSGVNKLKVDIMAGYVKDGKVYNLDDEEIGEYSEDDINHILDSGTMQVYNYEKVGNDYILSSVGVK